MSVIFMGCQLPDTESAFIQFTLKFARLRVVLGNKWVRGCSKGKAFWIILLSSLHKLYSKIQFFLFVVVVYHSGSFLSFLKIRIKQHFPLSLEFEWNYSIKNACSNLSLQGTKEEKQRRLEIHTLIRVHGRGIWNRKSLDYLQKKYLKCEIHSNNLKLWNPPPLCDHGSQFHGKSLSIKARRIPITSSILLCCFIIYNDSVYWSPLIFMERLWCSKLYICIDAGKILCVEM